MNHQSPRAMDFPVLKKVYPFISAHFGHHVLTALMIPLLPIIRDEFALSYTLAGVVAAAFSLSYGFGQLPAGWIADRWGGRPVITAGIAGVAVAGLVVGSSYGLPMLVAGLVFMGIMAGGYHPAASTLIGAAVEPQRRGRALGLHVVGGSLSHFLAPLLGVWLSSLWGWRGAFIGLSVPVLIFGFMFYRFLGRLDGTRSASAPRGGPRGVRLEGDRLFLIAAVLAMTTVMSALVGATVAFVPLMVVDHFGLGQKAGAAVLAMVYSVGLWAAPLGGMLADRFGRLRTLAVLALLTGPAIIFLAVTPFQISTMLLLILFGLTMFIRMPVAESFIVEWVPAGMRSTVLGVYFFAGMEAGGLLTPLLGAMIDSLGFLSAFMTLGAGASALLGLCVLLLLVACRRVRLTAVREKTSRNG